MQPAVLVRMRYLLQVGVGLARADSASACRRLVLPPTAVRLVPHESWSSRAKSFLRAAATKTTRKRSGELGAAPQKPLLQGGSSEGFDGRDRIPSAGVGSAPGAEGAGGTQKRSAWWAQAQVGSPGRPPHPQQATLQAMADLSPDFSLNQSLLALAGNQPMPQSMPCRDLDVT